MESFKPIIIIGAPRSGTNMLRDILTTFDQVGTWPCDEINYIWRHGNIRVNSDEFSADLARPEVTKYIRNCFKNLAKQHKLKWVVEKTCANSLRVPFVDKVLPEAHYIFIYRDGYDVLASAKLRWSATLDIHYILKKSRYVPLIDLPYYGIRYFGNRLYRLISRDRRLAFWGPQLNDIDDLLKQYSLEEICALQWKRCVEKSDLALSNMPDDKVVRVKYEDFVIDPKNELTRICNHFQIPISKEIAANATKTVLKSSIGKGRQRLTKDVLNRVRPIISETLKEYGYTE